MNTIDEYLETIASCEQRKRLQEVFIWIRKQFPMLEEKIAWKQPMFINKGTFIIGFSASKQHFSVSPEKQGIIAFTKEIEKAGYGHGSNLFRIKWNDEVDYVLLEKIILFNINEKTNCTTFWRP